MDRNYFLKPILNSRIAKQVGRKVTIDGKKYSEITIYFNVKDTQIEFDSMNCKDDIVIEWDDIVPNYITIKWGDDLLLEVDLDNVIFIKVYTK